MRSRGAQPPPDGSRRRVPGGDGNALQRLILDRLRERDWSYGAVARRGGISRSTVFYLATTQDLSRPPRPDTLEGLARGLELPIALVRAAAAEATGLHYYRENPEVDAETSAMMASFEELPPEQRRHVMALIESLRRSSQS
jgi:transcriptional regulator with XRE-family HTH domain